MNDASSRQLRTAYGAKRTTTNAASQDLLLSHKVPLNTSAMVEVTVIGHGVNKAITGLVTAVGTDAIVGAGTKFQTDADPSLRLIIGDEVVISGANYQVLNVTSDTDAQLDRVLTVAGVAIGKVLHTMYQAKVFLQRFKADPPNAFPIQRDYSEAYSNKVGGGSYNEAGTVGWGLTGDGRLALQVSPAYATTIDWTAYATAFVGTPP